MKLVCVADLHSSRDALDRILKAEPNVDIVVLGGDITNFGTPAEAEDVVARVQRHCDNVLAVAGNCDSEAIDERLLQLGVSVFRRAAFFQGVGFYGVSGMPPWLSTMYYLTEEEIAAALQQGRMQVGKPCWEVVISHPPPRRTTLDVIANGEHVGSTALRDFIETAQPHLVICGHIHESRGIDHIGETTLVNCGAACRGYYAVVDLDKSIEVSLKSVPLSRTGQ